VAERRRLLSDAESDLGTALVGPKSHASLFEEARLDEYEVAITPGAPARRCLGTTVNHGKLGARCAHAGKRCVRPANNLSDHLVR
jgi:hypothetical protein